MEEAIEECWDSLPSDIKEVLLKEGELQKASINRLKEKVYGYKTGSVINPGDNSFYFSSTSSVFWKQNYDRIHFWHRVICFGDYQLFYKKVPCSKEVIVGGEKFMI